MPVAEFSFVTPSHAVREVRVSVVNEVAAVENRAAKAEEVVRFFRDVVAKSSWFDPEKECFIVLLLNRKNAVKGFNLVSLGTQTAALAHPREVFRAAIVGAATAIVCIHNHPSGDPAPSGPDIHVTRLLREASRTVDIELLDHVIVGEPAADPTGKGFFSFREAGHL